MKHLFCGLFAVLCALASDAQTAKEWMNLTTQAGISEQYDSALYYIEKSLELDTTNPEAYVCKGFYLGQLGRDEEAYTLFSYAILRFPTYSHLYDHRAMVLGKSGQYGQALKDHNRAVELAEADTIKANYLNGRALVKGYLGDRPGKIADLELALKLRPDLIEAMNSLANEYSTMGANNLALVYFRKALALEPGFFVLWINIGYTYQAMSEYDSSLYYFNHAIELDSTIAEAYSNRSLTLFYLGRIDEAYTDINRSLVLRENNSYAHWVKALILLEKGEKANACESLKRANHHGYTLVFGNAVNRLMQEHCQ